MNGNAVTAVGVPGRAETARETRQDSAPRTDAEHRDRQSKVRLILTLPLLGFIATVSLALAGALGWQEAANFLVFYVIAGFGITIGYHRYFTHGGFDAPPWLEAVMAIAGALAVQGPAIDWVADHRRHHAHSDEPGDVHSPVPAPGQSGIAALWYAHAGWLFDRDKTNLRKFAPDVMADALLQLQKRHYGLLTLASLAAPALVGWLLRGSALGALYGLLSGGFARLFVLHHVTWMVNSICHVFGTQAFHTGDQSRNNPWLALPTLGESWHNNHHAFPTSASHGLGGFRLDPSAGVIWAFEKLGIVSAVKRPTAEQREKKQASTNGA